VPSHFFCHFCRKNCQQIRPAAQIVSTPLSQMPTGRSNLFYENQKNLNIAPEMKIYIILVA
jgi:hypothetical protein